jgi:putative transport protein
MTLNSIMYLFLILAIGYLLGCIKIGGIRFGDSAILLVALAFGHFGFIIPSDFKDIGLALFVCAVGFIAGPVFFDNFKKGAFSYICIGASIIIAGAICTVLSAKLMHIDGALAIGLFSGALTSTPALAVAGEVCDSTLATVAYGIAYPFGVVGVVLFCQLVPKVLHADIEAEAAKLAIPEDAIVSDKDYIRPESSGLMYFAVSMVLGMLIAEISVPLPGGFSFSLGSSGGPLLSGLLCGRFCRFGRYSFSVPENTLNTLREIGLVFFLAGAGTSAGQGFVSVLKQYGVALFAVGALITIVPMFVGYFLAVKAFHLEMFNALGSICGGMTSTPALGTLITVSGTSNVAVSYAATYPVALIVIVFAVQLMAMIFAG